MKTPLSLVPSPRGPRLRRIAPSDTPAEREGRKRRAENTGRLWDAPLRRTDKDYLRSLHKQQMNCVERGVSERFWTGVAQTTRDRDCAPKSKPLVYRWNFSVTVFAARLSCSTTVSVLVRRLRTGEHRIGTRNSKTWKDVNVQQGFS